MKEYNAREIIKRFLKERNVTTMNITAEVEDPSSEYEVSGPSTLEIGQNTFKIKVTSENGNDNSTL